MTNWWMVTMQSVNYPIFECIWNSKSIHQAMSVQLHRCLWCKWMGRVNAVIPANICQASKDLCTWAVSYVKTQDLSAEKAGLTVSLRASVALRDGSRLRVFGAECWRRCCFSASGCPWGTERCRNWLLVLSSGPLVVIWGLWVFSVFFFFKLLF